MKNLMNCNIQNFNRLERNINQLNKSLANPEISPNNSFQKN